MTPESLFPRDTLYPDRTAPGEFERPDAGARKAMDLLYMLNRRLAPLLGGLDLAWSGKPAARLPGLRELLADTRAIMSRVAGAYRLPPPKFLPVSRMRVKDRKDEGNL